MNKKQRLSVIRELAEASHSFSVVFEKALVVRFGSDCYVATLGDDQFLVDSTTGIVSDNRYRKLDPLLTKAYNLLITDREYIEMKKSCL